MMKTPPPKRARSVTAVSALPRAPTIGDRLSYAVLRCVAAFLAMMSLDRASALMGWLWRKIAPLNHRHRRADQHLARAIPHLSSEERNKILCAMWDNMGRTAAETLCLPRLIMEERRFTLNVDSSVLHHAAAKKGAIFASLHQGNWELCGWGIRLAGFPVAAVYKPLKNPLADAFLHALRAPVFDGGLYGRERSSALKLRTLARKGMAIGMLADLRDATGIAIPFLGYPAFAATLPAMLARRLDLPLIAGRVLRTQGAYFRIEALEIPILRTENIEADIAAGTLALNQQYETWIRDAPEQWMWAHRKWIIAEREA